MGGLGVGVGVGTWKFRHVVDDEPTRRQPLTDAVDQLDFPAVAAHRGGAGIYPENTLDAFRRAGRLGPGLVLEMDVRSLQDGTLVIAHDAAVATLAAGGRSSNVKEMSVSQWKDLEVKHPAGGRSAPAAFLDEVLEEYGGTERVMMIELKDRGAFDRFVGVLHPYRDQVIACSFDPGVARAFVASGMHSQLLGTPKPGGIPAGLNSIGVNDAAITKAMCDEAHDKGAHVWAWGAHLPNNDPALLAMGVDGFIVNNPFA